MTDLVIFLLATKTPVWINVIRKISLFFTVLLKNVTQYQISTPPHKLTFTNLSPQRKFAHISITRYLKQRRALAEIPDSHSTGTRRVVGGFASLREETQKERDLTPPLHPHMEKIHPLDIYRTSKRTLLVKVQKFRRNWDWLGVKTSAYL